MDTKIKSIFAREILDSRGDPAIEAKVELENGIIGIASVPSGASTGVNEALELRDKDESRYGGKGVLKACKNINTEIAGILKGKNVLEQEELDVLLIELDGTKNKSRLGANAILGVSTACLKAAAKFGKTALFNYIQEISELKTQDSRLKIPVPMFNILNGGKHADSGLDIQEFMVVPGGNENFSEQLRIGSEIFHSLGKILQAENLDTSVGNEGGYAPRFSSHEQAFKFLIKAGDRIGYRLERDFNIAIDAASSSFFDKGTGNYVLGLEGQVLSKSELVQLYKKWVDAYRIFSIEDGIEEQDLVGWQDLKWQLPKIQIVADDLTVTNIDYLEAAIKTSCANAIIIKPNQIGTVTETLECVKKAKEAGWKIIVSHRSGETCDDFIADFSVGIGADFIKSGAPSRGERVAKYNRLLEISQELNF